MNQNLAISFEHIKENCKTLREIIPLGRNLSPDCFKQTKKGELRMILT